MDLASVQSFDDDGEVLVSCKIAARTKKFLDDNHIMLRKLIEVAVAELKLQKKKL